MKNFKLILSLVLIGLIVLFFFQNAEELQVSFLFWSISTPRIFVLIGVLIIGIIIGWIVRAYVESRQRDRAAARDL